MKGAVIAPYNDKKIVLNNMLAFFKLAIGDSLSKFNLVDGIIDEFEDESGVDTGASTNESYDGTNDLYSPTVGSEIICESTTSNGNSIAVGRAGDGTEYRGAQKFVLTETTLISGVKFKTNVKVGAPAALTIKIVTNSGGDPSGTLAHANATVDVSPADNTIITQNFATPFSLSAGTYWIRYYCEGQAVGNYWALDRSSMAYASGTAKYSTTGGGSWVDYSENSFFAVLGKYNNMTLISNAVTAEAQPNQGRIVLFEEDVDAVTINTDLKAYCSRDGGTSWTQATLTDDGDYDTSKRILSGIAPLSAQPAGTSMKWKIESLNNKNLKLHGIGVNWG